MKIYYATDRARTGNRAAVKFYGNEPARELETGIAYVSIPPRPVHTRGGFEEPKWWKLEFRTDPARQIYLHHVAPCHNQANFFSRIRQEVGNKDEKEIFVFIHGFNVSFEESARRTAQISFDLDLSIVPVLFSWSSGGKILRYSSDEDMTDQVVDKLRKFLGQLVSESGAPAVHLIAQSMGNRFMARAVRELVLADTCKGKPPFSQVIMAAPDVKLDAFQEVLGPAIEQGQAARRRRFTFPPRTKRCGGPVSPMSTSVPALPIQPSSRSSGSTPSMRHRSMSACSASIIRTMERRRCWTT